MPSDVFMRLRHCFDLITRISGKKGVDVLVLEPVEREGVQVSPNDVSDLAALIVEELTDLHRNVPGARAPARAYYPGRRFPAHVYQRAGLLERILEDLDAAFVGDDVAANAGR